VATLLAGGDWSEATSPWGAQVTPPYEYKKKMYGTLKIRGFKTILQCAKMKDQKEGIL